ncbi:MAG: hypothetical protein NWE78_05750 [Candidatus Bathyarchaeota archaeon]|nr:hypothetical protein [Candidatus Bathyarchaeota archaeon]
MSKDGGESTGFTIAEKFFALLIILIGGIVTYNTATSPSIVYSLLFGVGGLALIALGLLLILAKAK